MASVPVAIDRHRPDAPAHDTTLNVQSVMGVAMLVGIVVNNAIVLVDYVNRSAASGPRCPNAVPEGPAPGCGPS